MRNLLRIPMFVLVAALLWPAPAESAGKRTSQYADRIAAEEFPQAKAPKVSPPLRWNFSGKSIESYVLEQESESVTFSSEDSDGVAETSRMTGNLHVKSGGNRTANLVLDNLRLQRMEKSGRSKRTPEKLQPIMVQGMSESGAIKTTWTPLRLLDFVFPVLVEDLRFGETETHEISVPISAEGTILRGTGRATLTFADWVLVGERLCVRLEGTVEVSNVESRGESSEYSIFLNAHSVYFFDPEPARIVRGVVTMTTEMSVKTQKETRGTLRPDGRYATEHQTTGYRSDGFIRIVAME